MDVGGYIMESWSEDCGLESGLCDLEETKVRFDLEKKKKICRIPRGSICASRERARESLEMV